MPDIDYSQYGLTPDVADEKLAAQHTEAPQIDYAKYGLVSDKKPERTPETHPEHFGRVLEKNLAAAGLGALDAGAKAGQGLSQLVVGAANLPFRAAGSKFRFPQAEGGFLNPDSALAHTTGAKVGEIGGDIATALMGGEAMGAESLLGKAASYGLSGAATQPGGATKRGITGALSSVASAAPWLATKGMKYFSNPALAKTVEKAFSKVASKTNALYDTALDGARDKLGAIGQKSIVPLMELAQRSPDAAKKISFYLEKPTIGRLHGLKSDLYKTATRLSGKSDAKTATQEEQRMISLLKGDGTKRMPGLLNHLDGDVEQNLAHISPEKYGQYRAAQEHFKTTELPFNYYKSIRNLLGKYRDVKPAIRRDIAANSEPAKALRKILNVSEFGMKSLPQPELAPMVKKVLTTLPKAALWGAGLGGGGLAIKKAMGE